MKKTPYIVGSFAVAFLFLTGMFIGQQTSRIKNNTPSEEVSEYRRVNSDLNFLEEYVQGNKNQNQKIKKNDLKIKNLSSGKEIDLSVDVPLNESGLMNILEFQKDEWTGLNKMPTIQPNKSMLFAGSTEDDCIFTIGVFNDTANPLRASECLIKYMKFTNGNNWSALGIDFTMDKKNIVYNFGEPNRDQIYQDVELLSYVCLYDQHIYNISFVLNAQTEECIEIAIDIDNRVVHKEY